MIKYCQLPRHSQIDCIRATAAEELAAIQRARAAGCDTEYKCGRHSGLVSALWFLGVLSEAEVTAIRKAAREAATGPVGGPANAADKGGAA